MVVVYIVCPSFQSDGPKNLSSYVILFSMMSFFAGFFFLNLREVVVQGPCYEEIMNFRQKSAIMIFPVWKYIMPNFKTFSADVSSCKHISLVFMAINILAHHKKGGGGTTISKVNQKSWIFKLNWIFSCFKNMQNLKLSQQMFHKDKICNS